MKKLITLLLALAVTFALAACGTTDAPASTPALEPSTETSTTPEAVTGASFTVIVTDADGSQTTIPCNSDKATVGEALLDAGLITGDQGDYGLYITSVNGITADWATENAYWAFYINGEYAQTGVDTTPITEGETYELVKTISYTPVGEGAVIFYLTVKDTDGSVSKFQISTDAATVGEALLALELIEGEQSDYGLYINSVNGITADWETEQAYWAFYIDGEYAQTGVDSTPITEGAAYELVKTISES